MPISGNTKVEITLKLLIIGIATTVCSIASVMAAGLGVLGWILSFTIGDLRDSNTKLQAEDRDMIRRVNDVNVEMIKVTNDINSKLSDQVTKFTAQLGDTNKTMGDLSVRMSDLQLQIKSNQVAWSDPKFIGSIADSLKKEGITGNVVIVPPR